MRLAGHTNETQLRRLDAARRSAEKASPTGSKNSQYSSGSRRNHTYERHVLSEDGGPTGHFVTTVTQQEFNEASNEFETIHTDTFVEHDGEEYEFDPTRFETRIGNKRG